MEWWQAVDAVAPYVVQISTPCGSGSGFLISRSNVTPLRAIATAAHVVNDSHWWEEPIRLYHPTSGKTHILRNSDRAVVFRHEMDTAAILFDGDDLPLPAQPLEMIPEGNYLKVGNEIGWPGFPAVSPLDLCFFTGCVSTWNEALRTYLVDGVAINGVSGGPAVTIIGGKQIVLIGVVSAYIPNRATGEILPGLSIVRDVAQFQELAKQVKTLDQAPKGQTAQPPLPPASSPQGTGLR